MKIDLTPSTNYGTIENITSADIDFVQRSDFVPIPDFLSLADADIPSRTMSTEAIGKPIKISKHFFDVDLGLASALQTTLDAGDTLKITTSTIEHNISNLTIYKNMQRLCLEVLDPIVDLIGKKPTFERVLLITDQPIDDPLSINYDFFVGNAVSINFGETSPDKLNKAFKLIKEFALFDRMIIDKNSFKHTTLTISVNESKRRLILRAK